MSIMNNGLRAPRIAILGTRGVPAAYGGFETFAEELSTRMASAGVEVTVYCEDGEGDLPDIFKGVRLQYVSAPAFGPLTTVLFDLRCLWHARAGYDVVYMLGYGAAQFAFIPRLFGSKVWLNPDGVEWMRAKWGRLANAYFRAMEFLSTRLPNRLIADAEGIKSHLLARHRTLPSCTVIPYGAPIPEEAPDVGLLTQWSVQDERYYLMVCRMEPENHVREIIEGFVASDSPHPLIIVGNTNARTEYARSVAALASDRVRMIGPLYDKKKVQALRYHCLAYFHGHSVGGTNPSLLEAMGCGNLVVAHENVFNREVLGDGGWFFTTSSDIPELVKTIEALEPMVKGEARSYVRERIKTNYSWERITQAYIDLLLADAKPPA